MPVLDWRALRAEMIARAATLSAAAHERYIRGYSESDRSAGALTLLRLLPVDPTPWVGRLIWSSPASLSGWTDTPSGLPRAYGTGTVLGVIAEGKRIYLSSNGKISTTPSGVSHSWVHAHFHTIFAVFAAVVGYGAIAALSGAGAAAAAPTTGFGAVEEPVVASGSSLVTGLQSAASTGLSALHTLQSVASAVSTVQGIAAQFQGPPDGRHPVYAITSPPVAQIEQSQRPRPTGAGVLVAAAAGLLLLLALR